MTFMVRRPVLIFGAAGLPRAAAKKGLAGLKVPAVALISFDQHRHADESGNGNPACSLRPNGAVYK
jgi:hypothetical protein